MTEQNGVKRSATDELRRLLDERGVPWKCYGYENHTWWGEWHAENRASVNGLFLKVEGVVTPEQAIAATLGAGTCRRVLYKPTGVLVCSECGAGIPKQLDKYCFLHYCPNCGRRVVDE